MAETSTCSCRSPSSTTRWRRALERALGWARGQAGELRVLRRSLDARKGRPLGQRLRVLVARAGRGAGAGAPRPRRRRTRWPAGRPAPQGRRRRVRDRRARGRRCGSPRRACRSPSSSRASPCSRGAAIWRCSRAASSTPSSNYCFGEGGAGTYLGRQALHAREGSSGGVADVIADLVRFGAPADIAVEARPHVGSNRLPRVLHGAARAPRAAGRRVSVRNGRRRVCAARGGRVRARPPRGRRRDRRRRRSCWPSATRRGRSTRGPRRTGIALERKPIAIGVRIEHPQRLIDELQYGAAAGHPKLPAAFYELTSADSAIAASTASACAPGGWIVPAATEADGVVVNGMSLSRRDSPFANAGPGRHRRRRRLRPRGGGAAGGRRAAAADRAGRVPRRRRPLPRARAAARGFPRRPRQHARSARPATGPGSRPAISRRCCPTFVTEALRAGLRAHGRAAARLSVPRTPCWSRPRRAPARRSACCATRRRCSRPSLAGLYPCGEGAGYAGGIVSAALDGARVAARVLAALTQRSGGRAGRAADLAQHLAQPGASARR